MTMGRLGQTAGRMPGVGNVMVTGGCTGACSGGPPLATTEFYDYLDGFWLNGPSMTAPRYLHAATLLPNGDLLVTGGAPSTTCCATTATAGVYTPAQLTVNPATAPAAHTAARTGR